MLQLKVAFCFPAYGGNGGVSSESPQIRQWYSQVLQTAKADPRISDVFDLTVSDTPITMVRNYFVRAAQSAGVDVLVMVDSDMHPDFELGKDPHAKPFWETTFDFLYSEREQGRLACVGAPYGGPPPAENVYVFRWASKGVYGDETAFELAQYTREEAAAMVGIQEAAALPTGLIAYDMRLFDITAPSGRKREDILLDLRNGKLSVQQAEMQLREGWFYYEWKDNYAAEKASTEDVTQTRDVSLIGQGILGYNPVHCNWDAWGGHIKPWTVGKPQKITTNFVNRVMRDAIDRNRNWDEKITQIRGTIKPGEVVHKQPTKRDMLSRSVNCPEHLAFLEKFVTDRETEKGRKLKIIEIGSWVGDSAIAMAKSGSTVLCVDTWEGSYNDQTGDIAKRVPVFLEFNRRVEDYPNILSLKEESTVAADNIHSFNWGVETLPADIIHIDAEHTPEAVLRDIEAWLPHLADDGVMIGHDYRSKHFPAMTPAVDGFFGDIVRGEAFVGDPDETGFGHGGYWIVEKSDYLNRNGSARKPEEIICG